MLSYATGRLGRGIKIWVKHKSQSYSIQAGLSMEGRGANTKPANFKRDDLVARKVRAAGSPVTKDGLRFRKQVKKGRKQTNNNVLLCVSFIKAMWHQ